MSAERRRAQAAEDRRRVRRRRAVLLALAGLAVFAAGIAFGQGISEDGGGGTVTYRRTIHLSPVPPTVTVTVTSPS